MEKKLDDLLNKHKKDANAHTKIAEQGPKKENDNPKFESEILTKVPNKEVIKSIPGEPETVGLANTHYEWVRELFEADRMVVRASKLHNEGEISFEKYAEIVKEAKEIEKRVKMTIQEFANSSVKWGHNSSRKTEGNTRGSLIRGVEAAVEVVKDIHYSLGKKEGLYYHSRLDALDGIDFIKITRDENNNIKEVDLIQVKSSEPEADDREEINNKLQEFYENSVKNLYKNWENLEIEKANIKKENEKVLGKEFVPEHLFNLLTDQDKILDLDKMGKKKIIDEDWKTLRALSFELFQELDSLSGEILLDNITGTLGVVRDEFSEIVEEDYLIEVLDKLIIVFKTSFPEYRKLHHVSVGNLLTAENINKKLAYLQDGKVVYENLGKLSPRDKDDKQAAWLN